MQPYQGGPPPPGGFGVPRAPQPHQPPSPYGYQGVPYGGQMQHHQGYSPYQAHCPRCSSTSLRKPSFTWWGGLLGPKLLNHTVCGGCGFGYNAKSGKSNNTAIGIYLGFGAVLGIILVILRATL